MEDSKFKNLRSNSENHEEYDSNSLKINQKGSDFNRNDSEKNRNGLKLSLIEEKEREGNFGFGSCEPKFLQCCNNAKGFLVMFCLFAVVQGMLVNGFINVSISTLERRFGFKSSDTGVMAVGYDIAFCISTTFITYFGARSHRPRIVGIGAVVMAIGALTFWLPHFTTPRYNPNTEGFGETCADGISSCEEEEDSNLLYYIWVFILAQLLHGFGCTPLYTLGYSYIEDSVAKEDASLYLGIANAAAVLGPVVGYALGGVFLGIYVDFESTDPADFGLTPDDPQWVGAWWLGVMLSMICAFIICVPFFAFPKLVPGTHRFREMRKTEVPVDGGEEIAEKKDFGKSYKDFPIALLTLMKNPAYVFSTLGACSESILISSFTTWLPKLIENEFQVPAGTAAIVAGVIGIPGGMVGHILSGIIVSRFNMKTPRIFLTNILYCVIVLAMSPILLLYCPNRPVAGITIPYKNSSEITLSLVSTCNSECVCQEEFYVPVCGVDNINYFSACHAGCNISTATNKTTYFFNCSCINGISEEGWQATKGNCPTDCNNLGLFLGLFFIVVLFTFMASTPAMVATFRVVPANLRSFAIGVQWLFIRALGTIPGPILFGVIIDLTCVLWQTRQCGGAQGSCWIYDSEDMAWYAIAITMACKIVSSIFFFASYWFYKAPAEKESDNLGNTSDVTNPAFIDDEANITKSLEGATASSSNTSTLSSSFETAL